MTKLVTTYSHHDDSETTLCDYHAGDLKVRARLRAIAGVGHPHEGTCDACQEQIARLMAHASKLSDDDVLLLVTVAKRMIAAQEVA